jgi:hypothetical protein
LQTALDLGSNSCLDPDRILKVLETAAIRAAKTSAPYLQLYALFNVLGLATLFLKCDTMAKRVTLLDPPPQDHSKAPIENVLDLTPVVDLGPVRTSSSSQPIILHKANSIRYNHL